MKKLLSIALASMMLIGSMMAVSAENHTFSASPTVGLSYVKETKPIRYEFDEELAKLAANEATNTADVAKLAPSIREMKVDPAITYKTSGGKMMHSSQARSYVADTDPGIVAVARASTTQKTDTLTFAFDINLPNSGYYTTDFTMANTTGSSTDLVTITLDKGTEDETVIIKSSAAMNGLNPGISKITPEKVDYVAPAEEGGTAEAFPWQYMSMYRCTAVFAEKLAAGAHTITVELASPTMQNYKYTTGEDKVNQYTQPHLFALDYIEFMPLNGGTVSDRQGTSFEFENLAGRFENGTPTVKKSAYESNGAHVQFDGPRTKQADVGNDITQVAPLTTELTLNVEKAGSYSMQLIASDVQSPVVMRLDAPDAAPFFVSNAADWNKNFAEGDANRLTTTATKSAIDSATKVPSDANPATNVYAYLQEQWHRAYYFTQVTDLEAGEHTIYVSVLPRAVTENGTPNYNVAVCLDNFIVTPNVFDQTAIDANKATRIEMEKVAPFFVVTQTDSTYSAKVGNSVNASGGKYMQIDSANDKAVNDTESVIIPISVPKNGEYLLEFMACTSVSGWNMYVDSTESGSVLSNSSSNTRFDPAAMVDDPNSTDDKWPTFWSTWSVAHRYTNKVTLTAGDHNLILVLNKRGTGDFALNADYLDIVPANSFSNTSNQVTATAAFDNFVTGKAILALYNGNELVKIDTVDVEKTKYAEITTTVEDEVTNAKVFVWNGFENVIPQTTPVILK